MRLVLALAAILIPCASAQASLATDLPVVAAAIRAGRLIQAEVMLARLPAPSGAGEVEALDDVRGQFALADGAPEQALHIFEALRAARPDRCEYARDFGVAAARLGDARAFAALSETLPRCASVQSGQMLGVTLARMRRWDESEQAFALSLRLSPDNAVTLNNRAFARIEQARYDEALTDLRAASRAAPGDRRIANNIDLVQGARGNAPRRQKGEDDLVWALRLTLAAKGALRAGRTDLARAMLAQAVEMNPYHAREATALLDGIAGTGGSQ